MTNSAAAARFVKEGEVGDLGVAALSSVLKRASGRGPSVAATFS